MTPSSTAFSAAYPGHPTERVKTGEVKAWRDMGHRGENWTVPFIAAMHRHAAIRAPLVVRTVGATGVGRVLDVGGGSGAYSIAFAQANPTLRAEVFDLATVTPIAEKHIADAGLSERVRARAGRPAKGRARGGLRSGAPSAICHMLSPDENQDLLRRAFAALSPGAHRHSGPHHERGGDPAADRSHVRGEHARRHPRGQLVPRVAVPGVARCRRLPRRATRPPAATERHDSASRA